MSDKDYFCAAAWTALYLDPDGGVDFCCVARNNLGNIKHQTIQQILDSDRVRQIRQSMIDNQPVKGCDACWRQDRDHRMQTFFNSKYVLQQTIGRETAHDPDLTPEFFNSLDRTKLKYLDLRWNNTCNFACMYCGSWYSSLWAEENARMEQGITMVPKPARVDKQTTLDYLSAVFHHVDWIYFAGGEPLAIKENAAILDSLYDTNPDCTLQVNTNLSMLENNPIFERLTKFKGVRWMVSGEAIGDIFEYMRWPGKWSTFTRNLQLISDLRANGHEITFNLVAMNINHLTLWDYVDYIIDLDLVTKPSDINLNIYNMREPNQPFAIQRMPPVWKAQTRELLNRRKYEIRGIDNYISALDDPLPQDQQGWHGLELTVSRLRTLDTYRQLDSKHIFPHVYDFINNNQK